MEWRSTKTDFFISPTFLSRLHYVWLEFSNFKPLFSVVKSIRTKRIFYAATVFDRNALKVINSIAYTFRRIFLNSYFECIDKNSGGGSRPQNRMKAVQNTDRYFFRVVENLNVAICRVVLRVVLLTWKLWAFPLSARIKSVPSRKFPPFVWIVTVAVGPRYVRVTFIARTSPCVRHDANRSVAARSKCLWFD